MAGSISEDNGIGMPLEEFSSGQRCQSGESLSEWRSFEQVENGIPSTSPYYDTDDNDGGARPSELHGRYTWTVENFSHISVNKRELRSDIFEAGGYKWYILIYPQGCDVCNHLSLFLCVANHEKLLPGWSHFAQFTIAVMNKDPKKSKYSDTLHRFWKKEHDWGWKKFMELSKIQDGFVLSDALVIKAQVQVIREKSHRPFRCLDCQYRRELVRVYLSNVELHCRRFIEEKRSVLGKMINDKVRWSSFCAFWFGLDQNARLHMSRDKQDIILKDVVKSFFIEKEVTSTLVMDSLYSGLRALERQNKNKKEVVELMETEENQNPIVLVEKDMFVLVDDILLLLERSAKDSLPAKDEKGPQTRIKEGTSNDCFNKDSIEHDERRLTELGRRTLEVFILAHIFSSKIEAAYQEAVAYRRQEELIREEAESELKSKRIISEKEKRNKKKQSKQKRSGRKGKDRAKDDKLDLVEQDKHQAENPLGKGTVVDFSLKQEQLKENMIDDISDVSDNGDDAAETLQCNLEDRDNSIVNWDTNTLEAHLSVEMGDDTSSLHVQHDASGKKSQSALDDSSSTCSTDSFTPVLTNGQCRVNSLPCHKNQTSTSREEELHKQNSWEWNVHGHERENQQMDNTASACHLPDLASCCIGDAPESDSFIKDQKNGLDQHQLEKEEHDGTLPLKSSIKKQDVDKPPKERYAEASILFSIPVTASAFSSQPKQAGVGKKAASISVRDSSSNSLRKTEKSTHQVASQSMPAIPKPDAKKYVASMKESVEQPTNRETSTLRPSSAPVHASEPNTPASVVQTSPLLSRSVSAAGRLFVEPSSQGYTPISYRNVIAGKSIAATTANFVSHPPSNFSIPSSFSALQSGMGSMPYHSSPASMRKDQTSTFVSVAPSVPHNQIHWSECTHQEEHGMMSSGPSYSKGPHDLDFYGSSRGQWRFVADEDLVDVQPRHLQGPTDDFPHIDIIDYLFDEEQGIEKADKVNGVPKGHNYRHTHLSRQSTFPGDSRMMELGTSLNCCRFDQLGSYPIDAMTRGNNFSSGLYVGLLDADPQVGSPGYTNGVQMDGMIQNHWQIHGQDLSLYDATNAEIDGYGYPLTSYASSTFGINGYTLFRPAGGH